MPEGSNIAEEEEEEECLDKQIDCPPVQHRSFCSIFSNSDLTDPGKRIRMSENWDNTDQSGSNPSDSLSGEGPQDADYSDISSLSYELESLIFARFPRSEHWKLNFVNKRCLNRLKSGDLYQIRREIGFREASVFMFTSGESSWWAFDREFKSRRKLPVLPSDPCFASGDKESLCAGTHLLVSGKEIDGLVVWRYELAENKWFKGPSMISPRCLFASATCGDCAYVAGGMEAGLGAVQIYDTAEKYNPDSGSWEPLPRMKRKRKLCSGCYMDNKFYVIGVVNNELYSLESSSNQLKVYLKKTNTWKQLGPVPVRADCNRGWGVAFKSLGNELLVIGASAVSCGGNNMAIYTCCPDSSECDELQWKPLDSGRNRLSHFILNCSVMVA
ncbi:UNVERIFIED_CONTAM: F-box/kelch-repeat protein [Sesamum angustifolium]|uniref:F-box/kelch-repeat protein n=1 Tax=Sesamum angustifolium TaxID=2727405 RepID=A0AAW2RNN5_9LAMI